MSQITILTGPERRPRWSDDEQRRILTEAFSPTALVTAAPVYYYSPDRRGEHPRKHLAYYTGVLQADAYAGFAELYKEQRRPATVAEAMCWAHGRRHFFELADIAASARKKPNKLALANISPTALERFAAWTPSSISSARSTV